MSLGLKGEVWARGINLEERDMEGINTMKLDEITKE